jgi:hypothetical protein
VRTAQRERILAALAQAGSLDEIAEARSSAEAWLRHHPGDAEVARDAARLAGLAEALTELGLDELPPSTGAR